jgi:hypothetical protein
LAGFIYKLYHPEIFQGHLNKQRYFEGWYFKLVSHDQKIAVAVIPGIAIYDSSDRHAFIQLIDGIGEQVSYHKYPLDTFHADAETLTVRIGDNLFTDRFVDLHIPELNGRIDFSETVPIKKSVFSPGIMGWYSFVPKMQCYHGIVSMHHTLSGKTHGTLGEVHWDRGVGYLEKDWGSSFPRSWIWMHSNHYRETEKASLMASIAHIPWLGSYFPGFIVVLYLNGREFRFATYNGAKMKCKVEENCVRLAFKRAGRCLEIKALKGPSAALRSPVSGQMIGKVNESLQARLETTLTENGAVVWKDTGSSAGLEVAGETSILETEYWRS